MYQGVFFHLYPVKHHVGRFMLDSWIIKALFKLYKLTSLLFQVNIKHIKCHFCNQGSLYQNNSFIFDENLHAEMYEENVMFQSITHVHVC